MSDWWTWTFEAQRRSRDRWLWSNSERARPGSRKQDVERYENYVFAIPCASRSLRGDPAAAIGRKKCGNSSLPDRGLRTGATGASARLAAASVASDVAYFVSAIARTMKRGAKTRIVLRRRQNWTDNGFTLRRELSDLRGSDRPVPRS